ncbi:hypothetical protein EYW49_00620 [Siculibacillus lacustris]|uniref:LPS export ABC transporter periplasmic protein LptC n=1 Tax=Siculibacillus lacustris TaxID=1549641 RepID=A0A4Q9VYN7_9HYPH|nr:LPS export ABC transporter periplasmic protein LptC [Siculibacillus lacustris]TBW41264.1 hypothetical protein EYW49_00620 [Siculibacillus lacustris]
MAETGEIGGRAVGGSGAVPPRVPPPAPDRDALRSAADRHSRRVRRLKVAIPVIGVAVVVAIAGVTWVRSHLMAGLGVRQVLFSKDGLTMVEPRLTGRAGDRRYDVTAAKAFQDVRNPKVIALEGVDGHLEMADGTWAKIESTAGRYDGTRETLDLDGDVTVVTSAGWRATTAVAHVDLVSGKIDAERDVRITGRAAQIDSDALQASEEGRHLVFTGNVRMTVQPQADAEAPPGPPAPAPR